MQAFAAPAFAAAVATPDPTPVAAPVADTTTVTIVGEGKTRQVQDITKEDLMKVVPGTSPLKTLDKLPGVAFQSADPFGAYEWSTRFSARGFNQNHLGFTLDNVPLGDMSYGNNNGLHISRAISSENIGHVVLSQGAGDVGTASTSNLGGTVQFYSSAPTDEFSLTGAQTFGSDSTSRTFARVDTGLLSTGTKAYLSVTRQRAEKSKGSGSQDQDQFNSKLVQKLGDNNKLSAFFNYSDRKEVDYQDVSLEMVNRLGYNWDNYAPDWQREDILIGATLDSNLSDVIALKTTAYHHSDQGQGHWYTPYAPSTNGLPISIRTSEYSISRNGLLSDLTWELGQHTINAGFWAERSLHTLSRNYYDATGGQDTNYFLSNPTSVVFKQNFTTDTTQFYAQDTMSLMDNKLKLNYGFKSPTVKINSVSVVGS